MKLFWVCGLGQQSATCFCKWSDRKNFRMCCPRGLCRDYSARPKDGKVATDMPQMNKHGCVPIKLYLEMLKFDFHIVYPKTFFSLFFFQPLQAVKNHSRHAGPAETSAGPDSAQGWSSCLPTCQNAFKKSCITGPHTFLGHFKKCFPRSLMKQDVIHISYSMSHFKYWHLKRKLLTSSFERNLVEKDFDIHCHSFFFNFLLWSNTHNTKLTVLTILKCTVRCITYVQNVVQPTPPSISVALFIL